MGKTSLNYRVFLSPWLSFWLLAAATAASYGWLLFLSGRFEQGTDVTARPILLMVGLFWVAFVFYWAAQWLVLKLPESTRMTLAIFATSALFRTILLPSTPIQEIDVYRYVWDGVVSSQGICPYRYPPQTVLDAVEGLANKRETVETELLCLAESVRGDAAVESVLRTVHFGDLPSPYPPVSQGVFAIATAVTPAGSSVAMRLLIHKTLLVLFDLASLGLLFLLLAQTGKHIGWGLAYGWCPLVLKEIANSGHLDSIAVFFCTLALTIMVCRKSAGVRSKWWTVAATSVAMAFGVGAKLYPAVLIPMLVITWWRRDNWKISLFGSAVLLLVVSIVMAPMLLAPRGASHLLAESLPPPPAPLGDTFSNDVVLPVPGAGVEGIDGATFAPLASQPANLPTAGIWEFLKRWEMNDLLFLNVVENLRPQSNLVAGQRPWFVIVPEAWSAPVVRTWSRLVAKVVATGERYGLFEISSSPLLSELVRLEQNPYLASGLLARVVMAGILLILSLVLAWRATVPNASHADWLRACFLTLAWCWLLAPTQNPWYLCWALPLLPFARQRAWLVLAACALLYYSRFWLEYHWPEATVLGTPYSGGYFFHFVVVWVEFGPWLLCLAMESCWQRRRSKAAPG